MLEFDLDKCEEYGGCGGACLNRCPVIHLKPNYARVEMNSALDKMRKGAKSPDPSNIFIKCAACFSCNQDYCPAELKPMNLILKLFAQRYEKQGLPGQGRFFLPRSEPNFWTLLQGQKEDAIYQYLSLDERKFLKDLRKPRKTSEILLIGCGAELTPYIFNINLLNEYTKGGREFCCGARYYQMGLFDHFTQIAKNTTDLLHSLGVKKIVCACIGCYSIFTKFYPEFIKKFDFEVVYLLDELQEKIKKGKIQQTRSLEGMTVTIHDPCFLKLHPEKFDLIREIINWTGATIVEMEHNKNDSICCGLGGIGSSFDISTVQNQVMRRKMAEARKTGANAMVLGGCSSCAPMLGFLTNLSKKDFEARMDIFHVIEMIQKATGVVPANIHYERGKILRQLFFEQLSTFTGKGKNRKLEKTPKIKLKL
ncbi:MAG: (Fe-S)-binding protein [Candidatus Helarchaeota archaeon]